MVTTTFNETVSFSEQVYVDEKLTMNLIANIKMDNPEDLSYSPAIMEQNLYMENREEMKNIMSDFENKVSEKQKELLSKEGMMTYEN